MVQAVLSTLHALLPVTGKVYHVEFDLPPADTPGLVERLRAVQGDSNEASQIQCRLTQHETEGTALASWFGRFTRLQRPVDGAEPLGAVLSSVTDAVAAILRAKTASSSARSAAEAAGKARESAERVSLRIERLFWVAVCSVYHTKYNIATGNSLQTVVGSSISSGSGTACLVNGHLRACMRNAAHQHAQLHTQADIQHHLCSPAGT